MEPPKKLITPKQRERARVRAFRPLALELGWIVYEWNRLHEALAELFADVVSGTRQSIGFAIWYAIAANERSQRDMLRAAIKAVDAYSDPKPPEHAEIIWL